MNGITAAALAAFGLGIAYLRLLRPWQLRWGASDEEVARPLVGDDLVTTPTFDATRAITIRGRPADIWPWLCQVGVTRAGWYSYDVLDNLRRPSARRIIPALQDLKPGDVLPMSPDGKSGILVHALDRPRSMIWGTPGISTWVWILDPRPDGTTRLITRVRARYRWLSLSIAFSMLVEFADIWMMRRMLLNLRERVESTTGGTPGCGWQDFSGSCR